MALKRYGLKSAVKVNAKL